MGSDELQRLKARIQLVQRFIAELERELEADPADFDAKMTMQSRRDHLQDIEQQRAELEAE